MDRERAHQTARKIAILAARSFSQENISSAAMPRRAVATTMPETADQRCFRNPYNAP